MSVFCLALLSTGLWLSVKKNSTKMFRISAKSSGVSKMRTESSQGIMQQWSRVRTQPSDAGFLNGWCELDVGGGGHI